MVELKLLDGNTEEAARLARNLVQRIRRGAVSPTTGAFESLDAVTRAFLAEARRLRAEGQTAAAEALVKDAERAIKQVPVLAPPLFAGRLCHDRGIVALALGRRAEALKHLQEAEEVSRETVVPCFRMRLLEDLLEVLDPTDPRRAKVQQELDDMSESGTKLERRHKQAPWLWKEIS
jgi:hypothetical protein